ncbi:uncharacterized protein [Gossypium hirsutum]|uniref:Uncharacterized protein n=1 Tax=Gossypium hirsutum TaxID=3635 RepID=A0A1U8NMR1_GOSHI|nr:uncharacterized protein LOC107950050 [Gossypium hirsutum]
MKVLLSKKKKLIDIENIAFTECCSVILTNKLPPKLKDPRSLPSYVQFENHYLGKVLCDLGASINLMPLSTFKKLGIRHLKSIAVTLQLANQSLAQPEGQIKYVLVRVDKYAFPTDLIILDCEENKEVPIILGRSFLATGQTLIDVYKGELTMRLNDEQSTFMFLNPFNARTKKNAILLMCLMI